MAAGKEESARQRSASEILEEVLEQVRAAEQRQQRAFQQLLEAHREFREEFARRFEDLRQDWPLWNPQGERDSGSTPTGLTQPSTTPLHTDRESWRAVAEMREHLTLLDQSIAAALRAIRQRLEELSRSTQSTARSTERLALAVETELIKGKRGEASFGKERHSPHRDHESKDTSRPAEERAGLRREWLSAFAGLQQQWSEMRAEEDRRWRAFEQRLQDLEHAFATRSRFWLRYRAPWIALAMGVAFAVGFAVALLGDRELSRHGNGVTAAEPGQGAGDNLAATSGTAPVKGAAEAWLKRADRAWNAGNLELAERTLREGVRLYPDDLMLRARLATLLVEQERWEAAGEQVREALRIDPQSFEMQRLLQQIAAALESSPTPAVAPPRTERSQSPVARKDSAERGAADATRAANRGASSPEPWEDDPSF